MHTPRAAKRPGYAPPVPIAKRPGNSPAVWKEVLCGRRPLLRCRRQRNRIIRERVQIGDHVGALAVLRDTGKTHRGAGNKALRVGDELAEVVVGPGAALGLHGGGEIESASLALMVADDAIEVRTDAVRTALLKGVAGGAFLGRRSALLDRGGLQELLDRLGRRGCGFLAA